MNIMSNGLDNEDTYVYNKNNKDQLFIIYLNLTKATEFVITFLQQQQYFHLISTVQ